MAKHREGLAALKIVIIARYFIAQGMHYMNNVERLHRLLTELALAVLWAAVLWPLAGRSWWLLLAFPLAHVSMVVVNGHVFAMLKHDLYWYGAYRDMPSFARYVDGIQARCYAAGNPGLARVEVYGSLTRGKFNDNSDLDVRFIAKPGFANAWRTCGVLWKERVVALFSRFPIDAYMFRSQAETEKKMKTKDEPVIVLYDATIPSGVPGMLDQIRQNQK